MSRRLVFRLAAQHEFAAAATWYQQQRSNLGDDFVVEVQRVLDIITVTTDRYPIA